MATYTWVGGHDNNNAFDGLNWNPTRLSPQPGDVFLIPAGTSGSPVVVNANSGTISYTSSLIAGPYTTLSFNAVTAIDNAITFGPGVVWNITGGSSTGDTDSFGTNDTLNLIDSAISSGNLAFASGDTLDLTGSSNGSMAIDPGNNGGSTQIHQTGSAATLLINTYGTVTNNGNLWVDSPGGSVTLDVQQHGTAAGVYVSDSAILVTGGTLVVNTGSNAQFANGGFLLVYGGTQASLAQLNGRMNALGGVVELVGGANGATLEVNTNVGGSQAIVFGDGNATLRIDATDTLSYAGNTTVLANAHARIMGFQPGDTIDLAGLTPSGSGLTYSFGIDPTWGDAALELKNNGSLIALLRFSSTELVAGTGTLTAGGSFTGTGNFRLAADGNGGTQITLQSATLAGGATIDASVARWAGLGALANGATLDWNTGSLWVGGNLPGQYQTAEFAMTPAELNALSAGNIGSAIPTVQSTVAIGSAAAAGSVLLADPFATLRLGALLTLGTLAGEAGGGRFSQTEGLLDIAAGGTLAAAYYLQVAGQLLVEAGGTMTLSGVPPFSATLGRQALDIENDGTITGGTVTADGAIEIGESTPGSLTAQDSNATGAIVTDTYTSIGGGGFANTSGNTSSLTITGPNTRWTDQGGDASTPYSGAMLVGGGYPGVSPAGVVSVSAGGNGNLWVNNHATLTEAAYAMLGVTTGSSGSATVSNGALWRINTGTTPPNSIVIGTTTLYTGSSTVENGTTLYSSVPMLSVGSAGSGSLEVNSGGTVQLGSPGAWNTFAMVVGASGSGTVNVDGAASLLDTGGGALAIGTHGNGSLNVGNGGTVRVGNGGSITGFSFGAVLGNKNTTTVSNGTTSVVASSGSLTVTGSGSGTGTSLFSVQSGNLVIGRDGSGVAAINSFGSLSVAAGDIFLGGTGAGSPGAGAGGTLDVNGGQVSAKGLWIVNNPAVTQHSAVAIDSGGVVSLTGTAGKPAALNLDSGSVAVNGGTLALDSTGTAHIGNATLTVSGGGTLEFASGYTGSAYRLDIGASTAGSTALVSVHDNGSTIDAGGPIAIGDNGFGSNATAGLSVSQGATVTASTVSSVAPWAAVVGINNSNGTLIVGGGGEGVGGTTARFNAQGALEIGLSGTGDVQVGQGGSLVATGTVYVGATLSAGALAGTGGSGTLTLNNNAQATLGGLAMWQGATASLDGTSRLLIGSTGIPAAGAGDIGIGSDGVLSGAGSVVLQPGGAIIDDGVIAATVPGGGNTLSITGGITGTGLLTIGDGATLRLGAVAGSDTIEFTGRTLETLALTAPAAVQADIANFYLGDTIDLAGLTGLTLNWNTADSILYIDQGVNQVAALNIAGAHGLGFSQQSDLAGGTRIFANDSAACFAAGTRIAATRGEVAVEQLCVGDLMRLARGGTAAVRWLGHRSVDCSRHPRPWDVWPIRVNAGAFGTGQPHHDLWLSPDHAVFIDGVLIPVRYLINGATIVQEPVDAVTYWHVELETHDILLAEGLPCESYLDTGNRGAFENGGPAVQLHPDFAMRAWEADACARLVFEGAELVAARSWLLERAEMLGNVLTSNPGLHLRVDGHLLRPTIHGQTHRFLLPFNATTIHLVSRSAAPAHVRDDSDDDRSLGVAVSGVLLDGAPVPLTDVRLGSGWYGIEHAETGASWRWTNGNAELAVAGGRSLEIGVAITAQYWDRKTIAEAKAA